MDDEAAEIGTTDPAAGAARVEPPVDKVVRDQEFSLFYTNEMSRLVGFLIVHGARPVVAADLAQETMVAAYRSWDTIDAPRAWIRTVACRAWWREAERDRGERLHQEVPEPAALLSAEGSAEIESRHILVRLLRDLPVNQRQVLAWTYDGYQPTEIAALLGKPPATVRSTLRAARAALKRRYRPDEETP